MPFWYDRGSPANDIDTLQDQGVLTPLFFGLIVPALFVWYGVACIVNQKAPWLGERWGSGIRWGTFMGSDAIVIAIGSFGIALVLCARFGWTRLPIFARLWQIPFALGLLAIIVTVTMTAIRIVVH